MSRIASGQGRETAEETASGIATSRERAHALIDASERIIVGTVMLGGSSGDSAYIEHVRQDAAKIGPVSEEVLASGEISSAEPFSERYVRSR